MTDLRKHIVVAAFAAALFLAALIWAVASAAWWTGFNAGADTGLCLMEHAQNGRESAMKTVACQNIAGKTPPADIWGLSREDKSND